VYTITSRNACLYIVFALIIYVCYPFKTKWHSTKSCL